MDREKIKPQRVIDAFLKHIPSNIRVNGVFLFGSFATGKTHKDSDIDFIVISPDFKKMQFMKRLELLSHIQGADPVTRSVPMDIIGYTPEEFKNIDKKSIIMKKAKKEGKFLSLNQN
ncbi:nucleotidyltransferase domain-containing protein [Candidatus Saganbacteria bacterium]|nr:nucleotidyltransferase domain-containing protein [Candidatus Saganbacteria bacterium]